MSHELHPALETVRPRLVAEHFDAIRQIPRKSGNEAGVARHIDEWALKKGFTARSDKNGNIAVDVPASKGAEDKGRIVLQGHMDMVCVKADGSAHDFAKDPIELETTDGVLHSRGRQTTLGADNGMGAAMALALADDETVNRPPMTLLFTVDEEVGMTGAENLEAHMLPKEIAGFVNLDSEEGARFICNGSAGGHRLAAQWPKEMAETEGRHQAFELKLSGFKGGHSGADIEKGHGNAIAMLNRFLCEVRESIPEFHLVSIRGGTADNVIPSEAACVVTVPPAYADLFTRMAIEAEKQIRAELGGAGEKARLSCKEQPAAAALMVETRDRILNTLRDLPNGPLEWIDRESGKVGVSSNIGVVETGEDHITVQTHTRAAINRKDEGDKVVAGNRSLFTANGATITKDGGYNGWQEPEGSLLVDLAADAARELGHDPVVFAYHAGLESAQIRLRLASLGFAVQNMSCVAIGPHIRKAHGVQEEVDIKSVEETYKVLVRMMEKLAA